MSSRSAGIRVGYGRNSIRNCVFQNLVIRDSNRGLGLFVRQEGSIENILFNNIVIENRLHTGHWWGKGEPLVICGADTSGTIDTVSITNVKATCENSILVVGQNNNLRDITLGDWHLRLRPSRNRRLFGQMLDLQPAPMRPAPGDNYPWLYAAETGHWELTPAQINKFRAGLRLTVFLL